MQKYVNDKKNTTGKLGWKSEGKKSKSTALIEIIYQFKSKGVKDREAGSWAVQSERSLDREEGWKGILRVAMCNKYNDFQSSCRDMSKI